MLFSGQDVPINAITSRTQRLLRHVIDSDSRLMGYTLRVTELRRSIPRFERNETSGEIEIGCLLRVRQSNHDEMVVSVVAEAGQRFLFFSVHDNTRYARSVRDVEKLHFFNNSKKCYI